MENFSFANKLNKPVSPPLRQSIESQQTPFAQQLIIINQQTSNQALPYIDAPSISPKLGHIDQLSREYFSKEINYDSSDEEDSSFYSAYLKVQQEKFQQQLNNLQLINQKLKQLEDDLVLPTVITPQKVDQQQRKYDSELMQFAYIFGQLVMIDSCKQSIKLKLRFKLFDVLQLFNLTGKKIQRKQFYQNVSKVLGNASHQYIDTLMRHIFYDKQEINRQQFSSLFRSNKQHPQQTHSTIPTAQLVKQFFSSLCQTLYFQSKLKKIAQSIQNRVFQQAITSQKSFSSEDIQRFVNQSVKVKLELQNIDQLLVRIIKPRRSGDYIMSQFIEWLHQKP